MTCKNCKVESSSELCESCRILEDLGMLGIVADEQQEKIVADKQQEKVVVDQQEKVSIKVEHQEKIQIRKLFLAAEENVQTEKISRDNTILNSTLLSAIINREQLVEIEEKNKIYQTSIEINRPKLLDELVKSSNILPSEDIAKIELARSQACYKVLEMIERQGDHDGISVAERKINYLTDLITEFKKKSAEMRANELSVSRVRNKVMAEQTEKLSPEEQEEYKRRARKYANNPDKLVQKERKVAEKKEMESNKVMIQLATKLVKSGKYKTFESALEFVSEQMK